MSKILRGGAQIGPTRWAGLTVTWPLASLDVESDRLILNILWCGTYVFERGDIQSLMKRRVLWAEQLMFLHAKAEYPQSVIFIPLRFPALQELLGHHGYRISDYDPQVIMKAQAGVKYSKAMWPFIILVSLMGILAATFAFTVSR